jgi:glycine C-acetyltransferase
MYNFGDSAVRSSEVTHNPNKTYATDRNGESATKEIALGPSGATDSTRYSLHDFMRDEAFDGMALHDRWEVVSGFVDDYVHRRHFQYGRVSLNGSKPRVDLVDAYGETVNQSVNLASNDYLNLTQHPAVIQAGVDALRKYGSGAGGAPLLTGTFDIHRDLEEKLAKFKHCEAAMLYTSGFGTNYGVLSTLLRARDVAIVDVHAHASIIEGTRGGNCLMFRHNDPVTLEICLKKASKRYVNKIVAVDGVYSMDGDIANLPEIVEVAHRYGALVMVDEAHATGVIGPNGRGTTDHFDMLGKVDIVVGTFSKALGSVGGFVAGSREMIRYLQMLSRPYFFSTASAPAAIGAASRALDVISEEPLLRQRLWRNIALARDRLEIAGFDIGWGDTAIIPLIIGDDLKVKEFCYALHKAGVYANAVPYPAVPRKLTRVRLSVTAGLTENDLDFALSTIERVGKKMGII